MFAVGVDVSNGRRMVAVLGARRSVVVQPHEVPHTADGFAELAARLHALDGEVRHTDICRPAKDGSANLRCEHIPMQSGIPFG